jgi:CHASE1-domain containing sensor protein
MRKQETKKQVRQSAVAVLGMSLIFSLGAIGFAYWDYREQVKFYNVFERGLNIDMKTGKPILGEKIRIQTN